MQSIWSPGVSRDAGAISGGSSALPAHGIARLPGVSASQPEPRARIDDDAVHAAAVVLDAVHHVASASEGFHHRKRNPVLDVEDRTDLAARLLAAAVDHARFSNGGLDVEAEVDDVHDDLHQALPDAVVSRRSDRHERFAVLEDDNRALIGARSLAGRNGRGIPWIEVQMSHLVAEQ